MLNYIHAGDIWALLFFTILTFMTAAVIYRRIAEPDNAFLAYLFIGCMLMRCYLSVLLTNVAFLDDHWGYVSGDDRLYTLTGLEVLQEIKSGKFFYRVLFFGRNLYTYLLAIFYSIFDFSLVTSKFINCYIGSIIPLAAYLLSMRLAKDRRAAKTASLICAFYPSLVFWSTHNLKEPLIIITMLLGLRLLIKTFSRQLTIADMAVYIIFSAMSINAQVLYAYQIGIITFAIVFNYCSKPARWACVLSLAVAVILFISNYYITSKFIHFISNHQWFMAVTDRSGYYFYTQGLVNNGLSGPGEVFLLASIYFRGLGYFLFAPFPWNINSLPQFLVQPQIILWYVLVTLAAVGFINSLRRRFALTLAVFLYIFIGISFWALTEGNVGAAFRHRDHFAAIVFIYAAIGIFQSLDYFKTKMLRPL